MSLLSSTKALYKTPFKVRQLAVCLIFLATCTLPVAFAPATAQSTPSDVSSTSVESASASRQEILKTFEREAHAAYSEARKACETLSNAQERQVCLAKAKLQFDADMRYAEKRATMGH